MIAIAKKLNAGETGSTPATSTILLLFNALTRLALRAPQAAHKITDTLLTPNLFQLGA